MQPQLSPKAALIYDTLRHFADTWGMVGMGLIFIGIVLWLFVRPRASEYYRDQAEIPFRNETIEGGRHV